MVLRWGLAAEPRVGVAKLFSEAVVGPSGGIKRRCVNISQGGGGIRRNRGGMGRACQGVFAKVLGRGGGGFARVAVGFCGAAAGSAVAGPRHDVRGPRKDFVRLQRDFAELLYLVEARRDVAKLGCSGATRGFNQ